MEGAGLKGGSVKGSRGVGCGRRSGGGGQRRGTEREGWEERRHGGDGGERVGVIGKGKGGGEVAGGVESWVSGINEGGEGG